MAVKALKEYVFEPADTQAKLGGAQLTYIGWLDHLMFCAPFAFPFPPDMPFGALLEAVLPGAFGQHPDFAKIDWSTVEWTKGGQAVPSRPVEVAGGERHAPQGQSDVPHPRPHRVRGNVQLSASVTYELTIEPLGQTIEVEAGQTLLDASLRAGVYLPHACGHGLCGTCKVQVLDGEVEQGPISSYALMDFEIAEGLCLACCATAETDVTIEADIDDEPDAMNLPVRTVTATVSRIEDLTPTIKGVWVTIDDPEGLPFQAGQYVNVELPGGQGHRPFSFAQSPSNPHEVELDVRYVPGGAATTWIHQGSGRRQPPAGRPVRTVPRASSANLPMLFLAGGSGLSSPRSMILDQLEHGCTLPITLVYGARNRDELYYVERVHRAGAATHPNFTYVPTVSHEPDRQRLAGRPRVRPRGCRRSLRRRLPRPQGVPVRAAGDDRRLHHHVDAGSAVRARHLPGAVHLGSRLGAGAQPAVQEDLAMAFHVVTARQQRAAVPLSRRRERARRHASTTGPDGVQVGCRSGGCGVCRVEVLSGTYTAKKMSKAHVTEDDLERNIVLSCRIFPTSDLVVRPCPRPQHTNPFDPESEHVTNQ
jgi:phenol hydroxylase P5 protein